MKKIISISLASVILTGCASSCMTSSKSETPKVDSVAFYKNQCDSLRIEIADLKDQLDLAEDAIQLREGEISYWGHKYDSCMLILNNGKRK